jgi:hypothetical protein
MADIKWSAFPSGGAIVAGDQTVGLRAGANVRLTANTFGNLSLDTNTLSSTNSNGDINLVPNGTGVTTVGTSTSTGIGGTGSFIVAGTSVQPLIGQASYSNGSSGFSNVHNMYKSRGASVGSQVAVVSGDTIGSHQFYGSDGTNFLNAATIVASVSGAVSAGIVPGQLVLRTATTLGAMTTAITISNAQVVTLAKALPVTSGGTGLTTTTANQLLYSSATSTIAGLATANNGILVTSNAGVPSIGNTVGAGLTMPSLTFNTTSGIIGTTTNDSAAAGSVGEYVSANVAFAARSNLVSTTPKNITSISLTAGDWDVSGIAGFFGAGTTTVNVQDAWISTTSATGPDISLRVGGIYPTGANVLYATGSGGWQYAINPTRISLSGTTTVYLSARAIFGVSTLAVYGFISARRRR